MALVTDVKGKNYHSSESSFYQITIGVLDLSNNAAKQTEGLSLSKHSPR
jgi:hypothetical protein